MKKKKKKPQADELEQQGVFEWPIWEKEVSRFDWHYDTEETCYLLEGRVAGRTPDGGTVEFGAGDRVRFPVQGQIPPPESWGGGSSEDSMPMRSAATSAAK